MYITLSAFCKGLFGTRIDGNLLCRGRRIPRMLYSASYFPRTTVDCGAQNIFVAPGAGGQISGRVGFAAAQREDKFSLIPHPHVARGRWDSVGAFQFSRTASFLDRPLRLSICRTNAVSSLRISTNWPRLAQDSTLDAGNSKKRRGALVRHRDG